MQMDLVDADRQLSRGVEGGGGGRSGYDLVDQYSLSDNNVERVEHYGPSPFVGDNLEVVRRAVADHVCMAGQSADVDYERRGGLAGYDNAGLQALPYTLKDKWRDCAVCGVFTVPGHSPSGHPLGDRETFGAGGRRSCCAIPELA